MPAPLRKTYPALDLEKAQERVRVALRRALAECGGPTEFTRRLNADLERRGQKTVTRQAVMWWLSEGTFVDERLWPSIELITDMAVTRRHLAPDRYPTEPLELTGADLNPLIDAIRWIEDKVPPGHGNYGNAVATTQHLHRMRERILLARRDGHG